LLRSHSLTFDSTFDSSLSLDYASLRYRQKGPTFINLDVFNQILDMDDDEEGDEEEAFSEGIVGGFFDQAETTFASMEKALYVSPH
jgi:hypothetical protein